MKMNLTPIIKNYPTLSKIGLVMLYLLFHLLILRPVRTAIFSWQMPADLIQQIEEAPHFQFEKLGTRLITLDYSHDNTQTFFRYKVPLGSFFFIGIIGLILIGSSKKFYLLLIFSHLLILLLSWIVLSLDFITHPWLLYISDFLTHYGAPLFALGIIPLAFTSKGQGFRF